MAVTDETLLSVIERIREPAQRTGLNRERGGLARGIAWAELSGRHVDGSWIELRLRHDEQARVVQTSALVYQPLSRGGRTHSIGDLTVPYHLAPAAAVPQIAEAAIIWLEALKED